MSSSRLNPLLGVQTLVVTDDFAEKEDGVDELMPREAAAA